MIFAPIYLLFTCCSIEDPFETHYDVAHVIKSAQMVYFRKEMLVSAEIRILHGLFVVAKW